MLDNRITCAIESAENQLNISRLTLMRALEEINRFQNLFVNESDLSQKANILNWTINYLVTGILPNLRIDLIARAQANLTSLTKSRGGV